MHIYIYKGLTGKPIISIGQGSLIFCVRYHRWIPDLARETAALAIRRRAVCCRTSEAKFAALRWLD